MVWEAAGAAIVRIRWQPREEVADAGGPHELFQVLRLSGERISEMADYNQLGPAVKAAKRFAAAAAA